MCINQMIVVRWKDVVCIVCGILYRFRCGRVLIIVVCVCVCVRVCVCVCVCVCV